MTARRAEFSAESFRDRAQKRLPAVVGGSFGDHRFNPGNERVFTHPAPRAAAVLVPLVTRRPEATLLLTRRTDHLTNHAGQVAFPGGKIDAADKSAEAAALRETEEEIGLDPGDIDVFERAPDYLAATGYRIAPVLGALSPDYRLKINPDEVADTFEVPLSFVMAPANHVVGSRIWQGVRRFYYEIPYEGRQIWGITAGILRMLYEELYEVRR